MPKKSSMDKHSIAYISVVAIVAIVAVFSMTNMGKQAASSGEDSSLEDAENIAGEASKVLLQKLSEVSFATFEERYPEESHIFNNPGTKGSSLEVNPDQNIVSDPPLEPPEPLGNGAVCGGIITEDIVLEDDLLCYDSVGLILVGGSNDILIDCQDHSITFNTNFGKPEESQVGIYVSRGSSGRIEINDCVIQGFYDGVYAHGGDEKDIKSIKVRNNWIRNSEHIGIFINGVQDDGVSLEKNRLEGNDDHDIYVRNSDGAIISNNNADLITTYYSSDPQIKQNSGSFRIFHSPRAYLYENIGFRSLSHGYDIFSSRDVVLVNNNANGNNGNGIRIEDSSNPTLTNNVAESNEEYGVYLTGVTEANIIDNQLHAANILTGHRGLAVVASSGIDISHTDDIRFIGGALVYRSNDVQISDTNLYDTITLMESNDITFKNNYVESKETGSIGLEILPRDRNDEMTGILIENNVFETEGFAFDTEGLHTYLFKNNKITGGQGMHLVGSSLDSVHEDNTICADSVDISCEYFQGDLENNVCTDITNNRCPAFECSTKCGRPEGPISISPT